MRAYNQRSQSEVTIRGYCILQLEITIGGKNRGLL